MNSYQKLIFTLIYPATKFHGECRYEEVLGKNDIIITTTLFVLLPLVVMIGLYAHMTVIAGREVGHDDVIEWKHFPRCWSLVCWIHRWPVNSPLKGQWQRTMMFSLICVWTNGRVNNRDAGDLRRYRVHYDVTVMWPGRMKAQRHGNVFALRALCEGNQTSGRWIPLANGASHAEFYILFYICFQYC